MTTRLTSRRLVIAMTTLVATDAVGGALAVTSDVNTWGEAWGSEALLAAPAPMIAAQVLCTYLATRERRWAAIPAYLLALACAVSVISGFFDGGLGNDALSAPLVAFQVLLLTVTGVVGVCAGVRGREVQART